MLISNTKSNDELTTSLSNDNEEISIIKKIPFQCDGFVSKPREGVGRSDSDRQYIFCNGRPVDLPSIQKLFNEVIILNTLCFFF